VTPLTLRGLNTHRSPGSDPGTRGYRLGQAQTGAIANTVAVYERMFSEDMGLARPDVLSRGAEVAGRVAAVRPDLVEEMSGIAAGAGQPEELIAAINARTELLAGGELASGAGECSVAGIASPDGSRCVLAQNWDFHPDLAPSRLVWTLELENGAWLSTFTEAGLLAKTGLNDAGLGVTLNFLASDADGGLDGLPVHVLLRMVLDSCRDTGQAARLLEAAAVSASACVTVASAEDDCGLAAYELSPRGTRTIEADDRGLLAHTNHFVGGPPVRDLIASGPSGAGSVSRLEQVEAGLREIDPEEPVRELQALLSTRHPGDEDGSVFRRVVEEDPWLQRCATLATVVYDLVARRMWVRVGDDPNAPLQPAAP
jgi:isopenicillin-N N-acyltransferase like protein